MLIQYTYLKGKMLMLNFDRKLKCEVGREFLIHTSIIWGHLDDSALPFFNLLPKKRHYYLTLNLCYSELEVT